MTAPAEVVRERGLYQNGRLWWTRVWRPPSGGVVPRSTGTDNLELANDIIRMLRNFRERRQQWPWLVRAADGEVALLTLYEHHAAGTLHTLLAEIEAEREGDPDVEPWVKRWATEHLPLAKRTPQTIADYVRQVRALIPAGKPFPRSKLTEDYVKRTLLALRDERSGELFSDATRRRYLAAWTLFLRYARRRVPLAHDPLEEVEEWRPENSTPRAVYWDHATRVNVLAKMEGEPLVAMTLMLGSGMELGAVLDMTGRHVGTTQGERTVVAPGSKNEFREERTIFVDKWAWPVVEEHARGKKPYEKLFTAGETAIRNAFYRAQMAAGLIPEPPASEVSGKPLWGRVEHHTIHDARHTYVVCRSLGLDGEPRKNAKFCSHQLGHADEQMVLQIYGRTNIEERLRLFEQSEAMQQPDGQRA